MTRSVALAAVMGPMLLVLAPAAATHAAVRAPMNCEAASHPPPPPRAAIAAKIGQYGQPQAFIDLSEHCGRLVANGRGLVDETLNSAGAGRFAAASRQGGAASLIFAPGDASLTLNGVRLDRHDFGAEAQARIQAGVHADPDRLRTQALAAHPPMETGPKRASDLISVTGLDPSIKIHTLYAGRDNFLGVPVYERSGAFLQRPAAQALVRVQAALKAKGFGLLITDAYRPWFATKMFWDATPPEDHIFVADPAQGSRHNRGCAVDLTLYELKTGKPVPMTGEVDEMSGRSFPDYAGGTSRQRWHRALLRREMERQGFAVYRYEWWHFDYKDWAQYPIGTATYTELLDGRAH